jgi:hypothetical protein
LEPEAAMHREIVNDRLKLMYHRLVVRRLAQDSSLIDDARKVVAQWQTQPERYLSDFHTAHGFYIDGVDETTACLPPGWRERAVSRAVHSYGRMVTAIAPATNDLIVSKLHPLRDKDKSFILACHQAKPLNIEVIKQLLADTLPNDQVRGAATAFLDTLN